MITMRCPLCDTGLRVAENLIGQSRKCPKCGHSINSTSRTKNSQEKATSTPTKKSEEKGKSFKLPKVEKSPPDKNSKKKNTSKKKSSKSLGCFGWFFIFGIISTFLRSTDESQPFKPIPRSRIGRMIWGWNEQKPQNTELQNQFQQNQQRTVERQRPSGSRLDSTKSPSSGNLITNPKTSILSGTTGNASKVDLKSIHLDIPILVTSKAEKGVIGNVRNLPLTFRRDLNSEAPLQIAIFEDRPNGAGQSIRSSVWLAAIVAALQRSDDMSGVRLTFDLSGLVDGPSAGGMICLSLLSLLDGNTLTNDFVFTGSILPDGTIGRVGHVVHKIKTASQNGFKRVLTPSYLRFQTDQNTGELIDLKNLAESLGMEYSPVANIEQAYRVIFNKKLNPQMMLGSPVDQLEKPMEELFIRRTKELVASGDQEFQNMPENERELLLQYTEGQQFFVSRENANQALRAGRFCHSYNEALSYKLFLAGYRTGKEISFQFRSKKTISHDQFLTQVSQETKRTLSEIPDPWQIVSNLSNETSSIASQFCTQVEMLVETKAMIEQLDLQLAQTLEETEKLDSGVESDQAKAQRKSQLIEEFKLMQLILAKATNNISKDLIAEIKSSAQVVSVRPLERKTAHRVEKFFYTAYTTAHQSVQSNVIDRLADQEQVTNEAIANTLHSLDEAFAAYSATAPISDEFHKKLATIRLNDDQIGFLEALNAQLCAFRLADASGVLMAWNELDGEFDEDGVRRYERTAFLSYLLRSARANAIESIAKCRVASIPCPEAIYYFQLAESTRDDRESDLVNVLVSYWKASLEAQALKMLFHPNPKVTH